MDLDNKNDMDPYNKEAKILSKTNDRFTGNINSKPGNDVLNYIKKLETQLKRYQSLYPNAKLSFLNEGQEDYLELSNILIGHPLILSYESYIESLKAEIQNIAIQMEELKVQNSNLINENIQLSNKYKSKMEELEIMYKGKKDFVSPSKQVMYGQDFEEFINSYKKDQEILLTQIEELKNANIILEKKRVTIEKENEIQKKLVEDEQEKAYKFRVNLIRQK